MTAIFYLLLLTLLGFGVVWLFISAPPEKLARILRYGLPAGMVVFGGLLTLLGRGGIGLPLAALGLAWIQRARSASPINSKSGRRTSTVRSAAFDMELDHETGEMDGRILMGRHEGSLLSQLDRQQLLDLYEVISSDEESIALLEAYLDRRFPTWREDADTGGDDRQRTASGSGPMTKEEAYQVLGLEPGASPDEVRKAWRNLMKVMHPDSGGSAFLAAKINAAKDILLD